MQTRQCIARTDCLGIVVNPHLGFGLHERQVAQRTDRMGIQDMRDNAQTRQCIDSQLGIKQGRGDKHPFH